MRSILVAGIVVTLTGCSAFQPLCPGTRSYDPQVCRGEQFQRLSNFPNEALQRNDKCNACIDVGNNCVWGIPQQCQKTSQWR
jgi:hypothetical protein